MQTSTSNGDWTDYGMYDEILSAEFEVFKRVVYGDTTSNQEE